MHDEEEDVELTRELLHVGEAEVAQWTRAGILTPDDAVYWIVENMNAASTADWIRHGFDDAHEAARWSNDGCSPSDVEA